jgi:hypothetical protein
MYYCTVLVSENDNMDFSSATNRTAPLISPASLLRDLHILVVIVAFDFSQLPHFEEVLQVYHDVMPTSGESAVNITTFPVKSKEKKRGMGGNKSWYCFNSKAEQEKRRKKRNWLDLTM